MFTKDDNTYQETREKSIFHWLGAMLGHDDLEVRGGAKVTKDYIDDLKKQIVMLENKNAVKDKYLKKLKLAQDQNK